MAEIVITAQNFEEEVLKADLPVLVDFWADWCGPCKMLAPTVAALAEEYEGRAKIGKVNVDEQMELAIKFGINAIPTVLVFRGGELTANFVGLRGKEELAAALD